MKRNYDRIAGLATRATGDRATRMRLLVDTLWDELSTAGVSWVGFYLDQPGAPDDQRMILGPSRNTPACSPIGLFGVCGQSLTSRSVRIVRDVAELGDNYIACDPRDRSEIVLPLFEERIDKNPHAPCWGVLDVDSWEVGAFDEQDAEGLSRALAAAGIHTTAPARA